MYLSLEFICFTRGTTEDWGLHWVKLRHPVGINSPWIFYIKIGKRGLCQWWEKVSYPYFMFGKPRICRMKGFAQCMVVVMWKQRSSAQPYSMSYSRSLAGWAPNLPLQVIRTRSESSQLFPLHAFLCQSPFRIKIKWGQRRIKLL